MEVQRKPQARTLRRCYQCCRHEEQLWTLAYEQVSPQARRVRSVGRSGEKATGDERRNAARRA
jgi:hypothetical protein